MSRQSIHISIPQPCHEKWGNMDATERGAFCHSCQKEVIDFSTMTGREVIEYLERHKTVCGRFRADQLDRDIIVPKYNNGLFVWRALVFTLLPLVTFENVKAVTKNIYVTDQNNKKQANQKDTAEQKLNISGNVESQSGSPLANAVVALTDSSGTYLGKSVFTDKSGYFVFFLSKQEVMTSKMKLKVSYSGFLSEVQHLTYEPNQHYLICMGDNEVDVLSTYPQKRAIQGLVSIETPRTINSNETKNTIDTNDYVAPKHKLGDWFRHIFKIRSRKKTSTAMGKF